jgi:hypothetical protein
MLTTRDSLTLFAFTALFWCITSDRAAFGQESAAALGVVTKSSWEGDKKYWEGFFKERNLPPTTGNGLVVVELRDEHVEGVQENDIIVRIGNKSISDADSYRQAYGQMRVGVAETIVLKRVVEGKWKLQKVTVTPLDRTVLDAKEEAQRAELQRQQDEKKYALASVDGAVITYFTGKGIRLHNDEIKLEAKKRILLAPDKAQRELQLDITCLNAAVALYKEKRWADLADILRSADRMGRLRDVELVLLRYGFADRIEPMPDGQAVKWSTIWDKAKEVYIESIEAR